MRLNDPAVVAAEYGDEERLRLRRVDLWADVDGEHPWEVLADALGEVAPRRALDAGCGTGEVGAFVRDRIGAAVVGVDTSPRMVELARERGLEALVANVDALPFADGSFDAAFAAWMLYHLPDLDRGVAELARVVRPGGRLAVLGSGAGHMRELWSLLYEGDDADWHERQLAALRRTFPHVETREVRWTACFPDRAAVLGYLQTYDRLAGEALPERMPATPEPFRVSGQNVVTVCDAS